MLRHVIGDEKWAEVYNALDGAGVDSMQAKWNEFFGVKDEVVEKPKRPARKRTTKKTAAKKTTTKKKTTGQKSEKKTAPKK